jgi:hypothetical protein
MVASNGDELTIRAQAVLDDAGELGRDLIAIEAAARRSATPKSAVR